VIENILHDDTFRNSIFERDRTTESIESITTIAIGERESRDTLDFGGRHQRALVQ
jgi:hypothetical protein